MSNTQILGDLELSEESRIPQIVLNWLNSCSRLPAGPIRYEVLPIGIPGMCMSPTRATYISRRYIYGGYLAHFHVLLTYRIQPGDSGSERLNAEAALNAIGEWATDPSNYKTLFGEGLNVRRAYILYRSNITNAFDNGDEDHSITFTLTYEVMKPL